MNTPRPQDPFWLFGQCGNLMPLNFTEKCPCVWVVHCSYLSSQYSHHRVDKTSQHHTHLKAWEGKKSVFYNNQLPLNWTFCILSS